MYQMTATDCAVLCDDCQREWDRFPTDPDRLRQALAEAAECGWTTDPVCVCPQCIDDRKKVHSVTRTSADLPDTDWS